MAVMTLPPEFLSQWRAKKDFTQARLAGGLGTDVRTIKRWESGDRKIPPFLGLALAAIENGLPAVGREAMIEVTGASGD